jgi:hypothetical protein
MPVDVVGELHDRADEQGFSSVGALIRLYIGRGLREAGVAPERVEPEPEPEPEDRKDVHTEHCCRECCCKYGDPGCTVRRGEKRQSFQCGQTSVCYPIDDEPLGTLPDSTDQHLAYCEIRGPLVARVVRGEVLTPGEQAILDAIDLRLDELEEPSAPLSAEVQAILEELKPKKRFKIRKITHRVRRPVVLDDENR